MKMDGFLQAVEGREITHLNKRALEEGEDGPAFKRLKEAVEVRRRIEVIHSPIQLMSQSCFKFPGRPVDSSLTIWNWGQDLMMKELRCQDHMRRAGFSVKDSLKELKLLEEMVKIKEEGKIGEICELFHKMRIRKLKLMKVDENGNPNWYAQGKLCGGDKEVTEKDMM